MGKIDKILRAKVQLQKKNPFYAHILLSIVHKPDTSIPTACINIKGIMRYNPEWIDSLSDEEIMGLMKHEALHFILEHLKRRVTYLTKNKKLANEIWQLAEDLVVNDILISSNVKLPSGGCIPDRDWNGSSTHSYTIPYFDITIEDIDKKSVEYIYDEIINQLDIMEIDGNGKGNGDFPVPIDNQEQEQGEGDEKEGEGDEGDGEGDKKEGDGDNRDNGNEEEKLTKKEKEILKKLPKRFDEHERPDKDEINDKKQEEYLKKWRRKFVEAVEIGKMRGSLPAGMERLCGELFKEKLNWRAILWRYITKAIPFDYYWGKPSRKSYAVSELFRQDMALPNVDKEKIEIVISVDTSGSITDEDLTEFISEMIGITKSFHNVDMLVMVADCKLTDTPLLLRNATPRDIKNLKMKGGGGTSHKPIFKWVYENKPNTKLLICLTDGQTEFPSKEPDFKTLWVLGGKYRCKKEQIPFGDVIEIPRYDER